MQASKRLNLSVQYACDAPDLPGRAEVRRWARAALDADGARGGQITVRFVDADEGQSLNRDYRGKDYATNVLTFAYTEDEDSEVTEADIIFCTDVLEKEAAEQKKTVEEHTAHLVVHGVLHAQGYDHEDDEEANEMEALETEILATLGYDNPYKSR